MLTLTNLDCGYHRKKIVEDVQATFQKNTITCIIGPNGCGKSTLLKSLVGLSTVQKGSATLYGKDILSCPKERAKKVVYMAQTHVPPSIPVGKLVLHGRFPYLEYPRQYREKDFERCRVILEKIGIAHLHNTPATNLSGGELQKVFLAMSLVSEAEVFLFDEPNSFLDIRYQLELMNTMKQLREKGKIVIAVLHDLNHAMQIADQIMVMENGKLITEGLPRKIYESKVIKEVFGIQIKAVEIEDTIHYCIH